MNWDEDNNEFPDKIGITSESQISCRYCKTKIVCRNLGVSLKDTGVHCYSCNNWLFYPSDMQ